MKGIEEIRKMLTGHKEEIKERFRVEEICIFGSYVRGKRKQRAIGIPRDLR